MSLIPLLFAAVAFQTTGDRTIKVTDGDIGFEKEIPLAELQHAEKENVALIKWNPSGWAMIRGTKLAAVRAMECTFPGAVIVPSVKVEDESGKVLVKGQDWEIDPDWAVIGSLNPTITNVLVSYDYRLPKTVKIEQDGRFYGSVYLDPAKTKLDDNDLFPFLEEHARRPSGDIGGAKLKCPKAWAKLEKGEKLRILAWGDSVTEMRYLPAESRWQRRFVAALKERFPKADIELIENGWGGRMTTSFIDAPATDTKHHYQTTVLDVKPDLVVSEFVNDAAMDEKTFEATYPRILRDFKRIGAEWIIVAPHYVTPSWMKTTSMKVDRDPRPFVKWERRFASENFLALAETPLIWGHLWREGIPYQKFFLNGINHPDHESLGYFVEALMELFQEPPKIDPNRVSREAAAESMVMIKNDGILPLKKGAHIQIVGGDSPADAPMRNAEKTDRFMKHGGGSSTVFSSHVTDVPEGLAAAGFVGDDNADIAVVTITRFASEGKDRDRNDWWLSASEKKTIDDLMAKGKQIVLLLNVGGLMDLKFIKDNPKIRAAILMFYSGHEGGAAVADLLSGAVNPSGRLADTVAEKPQDYPSDALFDKYRFNEYYEDGVYVGYRYFDTIPGAKDKVVYPFGHGNSYSEFSVIPETFGRVRVRNVKGPAGKQSVLVFASRSLDVGKADRPTYELKDFAKTRLLASGEEEVLSFDLPVEDLAFFDEDGIYRRGAWVVEAGEYEYSALLSDGTRKSLWKMTVPEPKIVSEPGIVFASAGGAVARRLWSDGNWEKTGVLTSDATDVHGERMKFPAKVPAKPILLRDVAEGRATMDAFLDQLTAEEMADLSRAQPSTFARGTAGFGNLPKYGVPDPQTSDGPNGIRWGLASACYPCAELVACSFDPSVGEKIGAAIAEEARGVGVDLLLAPALNIHRHPMCGRVFEYYSEDPVVSGKSAAALVRGLQRGGCGATIKHFAANGREFMRNDETMSVIPERALREIYLKGFKIAVEESQPWCVMTAYNMLNGYRTSVSRPLIETFLRGECGFRGTVMTDWNVRSPLWQEIEAGGNIKMPFDPEGKEAKTVVKKAEKGNMSQAMLRASAKHVLELVMKTSAFRDGRMPNVVVLEGKSVDVPALKISYQTSISTLYRDDPKEGRVHSAVGKYWDNQTDCGLIYELDVRQPGKYALSVRHRGEYAGAKFDFVLDGVSLATAPVAAPDAGWQDSVPVTVELPAGLHRLTLYVRDGIMEKGAEIATLHLRPLPAR